MSSTTLKGDDGAPLYAPVPIQGYPAVHYEFNYDYAAQLPYPPATAHSKPAPLILDHAFPYMLSPTSSTSPVSPFSQSSFSPTTPSPSPPTVPDQVPSDAPAVAIQTFPTPSELLKEISTKEASQVDGAPEAPSPAVALPSVDENVETHQNDVSETSLSHTQATHQIVDPMQSAPAQPLPDTPRAPSSTSKAKRSRMSAKASTQPYSPTPRAPTCTIVDSRTRRPLVESTRKARHRAIARAIGFEPTDPDTISSHEKKRHYFECLEYYVGYLHEQVRLAGSEPVPLERMPPTPGGGLTNKGIRTLLLNMEASASDLYHRMLSEEREFARLYSTARSLA